MKRVVLFLGACVACLVGSALAAHGHFIGCGAFFVIGLALVMVSDREDRR